MRVPLPRQRIVLHLDRNIALSTTESTKYITGYCFRKTIAEYIWMVVHEDFFFGGNAQFDDHVQRAPRRIENQCRQETKFSCLRVFTCLNKSSFRKLINLCATDHQT